MNQPDSCQMCKKTFLPGDDIVICPHCGAPYHRECYQKEGRCVYTDQHAQGFEYSPPSKAGEAPGQAQQPPPTGPAAYGPGPVPPGGGGAQSAQAGASGSIVCPACSTLNNNNNIFCERCGYPLHSPAQAGQSSAGQGQGGQYQPPGQPPPFMAGAGWQQAHGGADLQGEFDGIDKKDWAAFIGPSAPAYFLRMNQQDRRNSKFSFTLSAFFVSCFYFAYRKMWAWALVAFIIQVALNVPTCLFWLLDAGIALPGLTISGVLLAQDIATYLALVNNMFFGLFALHLYRKDAGKKIRALKDSGLEGPAYQAALQKKGGVSVLAVVAILAVIFVLFLLFIYYGGETLMYYFLEPYKKILK